MKKGGLNSFYNSILVHKCKTLASKHSSTLDAGDKRPSRSGGTGSCNSMVVGMPPRIQHASPPPMLHSLNIDDVALVFTTGKVGDH